MGQDPKLRKSRRAKHTKGEKEHGGRIKKKIRELQALLPSSNKLDMISVLDEAIVYAKSLQFQVSKMLMESKASGIAPFGAPTPELQCGLWHPQFEAAALRINQGRHCGHGNPCMGCYATVPLISSSPTIVHSSLSRASTVPWFHGVPSFPMHVMQFPHPPFDLQPGGPGFRDFSSSTTDDAECSQSVHLHAPADQAQKLSMGSQK